MGLNRSGRTAANKLPCGYANAQGLRKLHYLPVFLLFLPALGSLTPDPGLITPIFAAT